MKTIIALAMLALSLTTFACPTLEGTFKSCKRIQGGPMQKKSYDIKQTLYDSGFEFSVTEIYGAGDSLNEVYKADGKTYEKSITYDSLPTQSYSQKSYCQGNELVIETVTGGNYLSVIHMSVSQDTLTVTQKSGDSIPDITTCK